jgi:hypothetical protein
LLGGRPVANQNYTGVEGARFNEPEGQMDAVWKKALPAAQDNGVDHEPVLIDLSELHQSRHELAAAYDCDVPSELMLEFSDCFRNISFDQS